MRPRLTYERKENKFTLKAPVLQTATDLIRNNDEVHGVADAVGSRKWQDWEVGLRWTDKKGR